MSASNSLFKRLLRTVNGWFTETEPEAPATQRRSPRQGAAITDEPPPQVKQELKKLSQALTQQIPSKKDDNLLVATWNIRAFASLTRKWTAEDDDSPKRDLRGLRAIIEILSRFDVIAIQELKGDLRALRDTLRYLGDDWGFLMTDVNSGRQGNSERFAFLFDRRRLRPSGLAAELVIPLEQQGNIASDALQRQFARSPYAVSFQRDNTTFILVTLHVLFGKHEDERLSELKAIARWMKDWAEQSNRYHHNLLALGDFNIDREGSDGYEAFTSTGLTVPPQLLNLPRTIFDKPGNSKDDKFYDQITWFEEGDRSLLDMQVREGGNFDFMPYLYRETDLTPQSISYRMSDHLPRWIEFELEE